jgi:chromosome condensin MukBEF MukE localization factor
MNVTEHQLFPKLDTALRRGIHITSSDYVSHEFLARNFVELATFYGRYDASLIDHPDGFFFLRTDGSVIPNRSLSKPCMHLGQLLAYLARESAIARTRGILQLDELYQTMSTMCAAELLAQIYVPNAKNSVSPQQIKNEILRCLKVFAQLNMITFERGREAIQLTEAIGRFTEMARHNNCPSPAAKKNLEINRGVEFDTPPDLEDSQEDDNEQN